MGEVTHEVQRFVKRYATIAARLPVSDFEHVKKDFLERIKTAVDTHSIPMALIIN